MKSEEYNQEMYSYKDKEKRREHSHRQGAKTFRRGRAIAFLDMMNRKRSTIIEQLHKPEYQSIHQVLVGELKAMDTVINEFKQLFEIEEAEMSGLDENVKEKIDAAVSEREPSSTIDEKGSDLNETN